MPQANAWLQPTIDLVKLMIDDGKSPQDVADRTKRTVKAVLSMANRNGLGPWKHFPEDKRRAIIPPTFLADCHTMTQQQLSEKYQRARSRISEWEKRVGFVRPKRVPATPKPKSRNIWRYIGPKPADILRADTSEVGLAVSYLRTLSAITKCDANGRDDPEKGTHWRRGSSVYDAAGIVERAAEVRQIEARRQARAA